MKCKFRTEELQDNNASAKAGEDFEQKEGMLEFGHNETVKEIRI